MQFASERWLHFYKNVSLGIQVSVAALSLVFLLIPSVTEIGKTIGVSPLTLSLSIVHIGYSFFLYRFVQRYQGSWVATSFCGGILTLTILALMTTTGMLQSPWIILWLILCLLGGIFGMIASSGPAFVITLYYIIDRSIRTSQQQDAADLLFPPILVVVASALLCVISWMIWRTTYVDRGNMKIKELSGELKNKEQLSEVLIQSMIDAMIVVDTTGKITIINPAAAMMTGWSESEATGLDVRAITKFANENGQPLTDESEPFEQVLSNKQALSATYQLTSRSGKTNIISLVISPVVLPKQEKVVGAVAILRDISAAKAEEARRAEFISTASHEMRTPVAAIEGYLALALNDKVSQIDSKARGFITKAHASTQHLGKLFQDLLTSAKAEDGRLVSHPSVVEMGEFLEQVTDSLRFSAEKKGLLLDFTIGINTSHAEQSKVVRPLYYTYLDPDRLREVITNLFDNAVKYTQRGKIAIGLTGNNEVVQLYIKDTGPGIPPEDVPHLFQKFYRVDNSATRTIGGTGLGLFICKKIVQLYQGKIWVESKPGQGSTFYINLPRISSQKAAELQKTDQTQQLLQQ
jgi:PAS domain S-box-containing protein